ncbi:MAG: hypothetical protein ABF743_12420, partial [Schleiferilactobacillus perolens]|uniref:hypothetical protein n=1 Tax=Schleiferilactobacillus perolens TaxID=100468 RepID=UPI0039EC9565
RSQRGCAVCYIADELSGFEYRIDSNTPPILEKTPFAAVTNLALSANDLDALLTTALSAPSNKLCTVTLLDQVGLILLRALLKISLLFEIRILLASPEVSADRTDLTRLSPPL